MKYVEKISISESISEAWQLVKGDVWSFVFLFIMYIFVSQAASMLIEFTEKGSLAYYFLVAFSFITSLFLTAGFIDANLRVLDGSKLDISLLFKNYKYLLRLFLANIALCLINMIGFFCLLIPGTIFVARLNSPIPYFICFFIPIIIVIIRLSFTFPLIVDKNLDVIDSIKTSWQMTRGNFWGLFGLFLVFFLIILIGILALVVGILVAFPLVFLTYFVVYKKLLPNAFMDNRYSPTDKISL